MAGLTSDSEKMDTLVLSLAFQSRNGRMDESRELKSFLYYRVPLLSLSTKAYLIGANFDDDSFSGEGRILRKYLKRHKSNSFLVDKSICNEIASLSQFVLGKYNQQFVNGKNVESGDLVLEFSPEIKTSSFDKLFNSSFHLSHMSVQELKRGLPGWRSIMEPGIVENFSTYILFFARGGQLAFVGPIDTISALRRRAECLIRPWSEAEFFLDTVDVTKA